MLDATLGLPVITSTIVPGRIVSTDLRISMPGIGRHVEIAPCTMSYVRATNHLERLVAAAAGA